jgi:hypothetical protein
VTPPPALDQRLLPALPAWVRHRQGHDVENIAFRAGAVAGVLGMLIGDCAQAVPVRLVCSRLALQAAVALSALEGRLAGLPQIRDAYYLTPLGHARGPEGDLLAFCRRTLRLRPGGRAVPAGLSALAGPALAPRLGGWLQAGAAEAARRGPLAGSARVLQAVLQADAQAERLACLMSDLVLARALHWPVLLPVTAACLTGALRRDLTRGGAGSALQVRLLGGLLAATDLARALAARAAALQAVAPQLRARGAAAAVALFLREEAVAPGTMLSPVIQGTAEPMTSRSARRFCDRLVSLGVAREFTGRDSFRLYGIAP